MLWQVTLGTLLVPMAASLCGAQEVTAAAPDNPLPVAVAAPVPADPWGVTVRQSSLVSEPGGQPCGGDGVAATCDGEKQAKLQQAVAGAYKNVFYENNFDYLCDPCYSSRVLGDQLKRLSVTDGVIVDVGGQYRLRHHSERNFRNGAPYGPGLTGFDDDFLLHRTRLYVNAEVGTRFRFYGEMLDAVSNYEELTPRPIEENRTDIQNLFGDFLLLDGCRGSLTARLGRQELQYGSQRLISPLDWANTRRTFDGGQLLWKGTNWNVDALWTRPLQRRNPDYLTRLDAPAWDEELYGLFSTYKGLDNGSIDLYWLAYDNHAIGFLYDTLGARWSGDRGDWLYEFEGAYQFGRNADGSDHAAGAWTLGLGRRFSDLQWKPTLWAFYDWASGDDTRGNGFHHLFPLAHKYLGFMDLFGRRNIQTANLQLTMAPHDKLRLLAWYYYFALQNIDDVPYDVVMAPFANLPAGSAGSRDLGHEIDLSATWLISPRTNLVLGYSHFFSGAFYDTSPVPYSGDADFLWTQFTVNF
jgi:hypothetical protein